MKQIASPGSMHETGCSGLVHWDDPEGWDGEGGSGWGTHVHPWLIHVNIWQKPLQYCKVISLQLKKNKKRKKNKGETTKASQGKLSSPISQRFAHEKLGLQSTPQIP